MSSNPPEEPSLATAVVQAWRDDAEHDPDAARAYLQFLKRRPLPGRAHPLRALGWLGIGMLLGMGSLYAATDVPWRQLLSTSTTLERHGSATRAPALPRAAVGAPATSLSRPALVASAPAPPHRDSPAFSEPVEPPSSSAARESWLRAARALRERDFDTANEALARLSQQGSQTEREAAILVRAQFLSSEQRSDEARTLLLALAGTASSPRVRDKANKLLASMPKTPDSHRSFEETPSTNPP